MSDFFDEFDDTIHAPRRLAICAFLTSVDAAEFATVRDALGISESSLSKQIRMLSDAGYVSIERVVFGGRRRMWIRLTPVGRRAFDDHVENLRRILGLNKIVDPR